MCSIFFHSFALLQESHMGGLMGHFGREKTYMLLSDHFAEDEA